MTTISLIEHFKKQSKALVKAVRAGDPKAIARVKAVRHGGVVDFGVMKAQHVVAREAGFKSWEELIHASEDQLLATFSERDDRDLVASIRAVMEQQPHLTIAGFRAPSNHGSDRVDPVRTPEKFHEERARFLGGDGRKQVQRALQYFAKVRSARVTKKSRGSYGLKHAAENFAGDYVANGALIMAALVRGVPIKRDDERSLNCLVGVNEQDVRALSEGLDPATLQSKPAPFVRWLFAQADRGDPVGDLASDAKSDLHFPRSSEDAVKTYLQYKGAHIDEALSEALAEFHGSRSKRRRSA